MTLSSSSVIDRHSARVKRNLRPCCASCNFDMGKHNMFDYLEICGWMVDDEKEWRAWKDGL